MVYSIGKVSVYGTEPDYEVVGEKEGVWDKVDFLNPEDVDNIAKGRDWDLMGYGYPVAPETAPKAVIWKSKTKLPPDYAFGNNQIMLVSRKFRELVEEFEFGTHQFLPVSIFSKKEDMEPFDKFYWFVCCQLIDSLDPRKTTIPWRGDYNKRKEDGFRLGRWHFEVTDPPQIPVFSSDSIGLHHLWRDPYRARDYVHCSNAFGQVVIDKGLTGFGLRQYEQI